MENAVASRAHSRNESFCNWPERMPATIASPAPTVLFTSMSGGRAMTDSVAVTKHAPSLPIEMTTSSMPAVNQGSRGGDDFLSLLSGWPMKASNS